MKQLLTITIVLLSVFNFGYGQFTKSKISTSFLNFVEINETAGVCLAGGDSLYKSTNNGISWTAISPISGFSKERDGALIVNSNEYYLLIEEFFYNKGMIYKTTNGGNSWVLIKNNPNGSMKFYKSIKANGNTIIASTLDGIHRSDDNGSTWTEINIETGTVFWSTSYNSANSTWYASSETGNLYKSLDDGITWTSVNTPSYISNNTFVKTYNDTTYFLTSETQSPYYELDDNYSVIDSNMFHYGTNNLYLRNLCFLDNNTFVNANNDYFYEGNKNNHTVYKIIPNISLPPGISRIKSGSNFALAVNSWGWVVKYDFNIPTNKILEASAGRAELDSFCIGEDLHMINKCHGYDSLAWFDINGQFLTTTDTLTVTGLDFDSIHPGILHSWFNGVQTVDTFYTFTAYKPSSAEVAVNINNTTPCYNQPTSWNISVSGNSFNSTEFEIWYNDSLYYTINGSNSGSSSSHNTFPVTSNDTVWKIRKINIPCGLSIDSTPYVIYANNDFSNDFNHDITQFQVCYGQDQKIRLYDVKENFYYKIHMTLNKYPNWQYDDDQTAINSSDTLIYDFPYTDFNPLFIYDTLTTQDIYSYKIQTIDTMGCSMYSNVNTFEGFNPRSNTNTKDFAYLVGDSCQLFNFHQYPNFNQWYANNGVSFSSTSSIQPKITSSTPGLREVTHINTPIPGCMDSSTIGVVYGSQMYEDSLSLDYVKTNDNVWNLTISKLDNVGNSYEVYLFSNTGTALCKILKRNEYGDTIWHKGLFDTINTAGPSWANIKDIEIGNDGFVYGIACIKTSSLDTIDGIHLESNPNTSLYDKDQFVFKLNPSTGNFIYFNLIETAEYYKNLSGSSTLHTYDLIDMELAQNIIYISTTNSVKEVIITCDYSGNLIDYTILKTGSDYNIEKSYNGHYFSYELDTYNSPQIEVRNDNSLQVVVFTKSGYVQEYYSNPNGTALGGSLDSGSIYTFKCSPNLVISDIEYLANTGNENKSELCNFTLDNDNNIYLSSALYDGSGIHVSPGTFTSDSVSPLNKGTSILKYDENYNLKWIINSTKIGDLSMDFVDSKGYLMIGGYIPNNVGFIGNSQSQVLGEYFNISSSLDPNAQESEYAQFPNLKNRMYNVFLSSISKSGEFISGDYFNCYSPSTFLNSPCIISTSACGDVLLTFNHLGNPAFNTSIKNQNYSISNTTSIKYTKDTTSTCSYISLSPDTLQICSFNTDSVFVPINSVYYTDSLTYQVYQNNVKVDSATVNIQNKFGFSWHLNANTNTTDDLLLITTLPNVDTLVIQQFGIPTPPNFSYTDSLCHDLSQLISPNLDFDYTWEINGSTSINDTLNFTPSIYTLDSNLINVHTIDNNGCYYDDTLHINVTPPGNPGILSDYTLYCDSSLSITYDTVGFSTSNITVNGNSTSNFFDENNLVYGTNPTYFYLTDTLGCSQTEYTHINNTFVPTTQFDSIYEVSCFDDLTIQYFGNFNSAQWIINGDSSSNPIPNEDLSNGLNDIEVYLSDQNGCESLYSFDILKNSFINAQIDSIYYLECDSTLSVPLDSNAYYSITWYMHTVPSNNYYWLANLSEGDNFGSLEVIDTNGCAMNYDFIVNYCYNLSTSNEDEQQFSVYPNPNNGSFYVDIPGELKSKNNILRLYNDQGKLIYESQINENQNKISLSPAPAPGSYYITINLDNFEKSNKIIIH